MIEDDVRPKDKFGGAVAVSLGIHLAVAILLLTRAFFAPSDPLALEDAIRVDIVGLPQKMLPDQPLPPEPAAKTPPPPKAAPAPAPTPPPPKADAPKFVEKPVEKPKPNLKHEQKDAFAKLRAMEALANMKREAEERDAAREKAAADARARAAAPPPPIAGHKVSAGNSLTGVEKLDYNRYGADIRARVLANWKVPSWLAEADLRAKVRVWVDDTGAVTKKQIFLSSGNEVFDQAALDAVDASNPFPAPPENLRGVLGNEGFTLGLPR